MVVLVVLVVWLVGGWWLVVGGWWLVVGGWWLVVGWDTAWLRVYVHSKSACTELRAHEKPWLA